jgi:hypothetical protein
VEDNGAWELEVTITMIFYFLLSFLLVIMGNHNASSSFIGQLASC